MRATSSQEIRIDGKMYSCISTRGQEAIPPEGFQILRGLVLSGYLQDLLMSDDQYHVLRP